MQSIFDLVESDERLVPVAVVVLVVAVLAALAAVSSGVRGRRERNAHRERLDSHSRGVKREIVRRLEAVQAEVEAFLDDGERPLDQAFVSQQVDEALALASRLAPFPAEAEAKSACREYFTSADRIVQAHAEGSLDRRELRAAQRASLARAKRTLLPRG